MTRTLKAREVRLYEADERLKAAQKQLAQAHKGLDSSTVCESREAVCCSLLHWGLAQKHLAQACNRSDSSTFCESRVL